MLGIFNDERRGSRPKAPDPSRTGPLFAQLQEMAAAARMSCVGPATQRHPLLSLAKNGSRHGRNLNLNKP